MAKLTFVLEDGQEVVVPLVGLITLGRDDDNDVVIEHECISRHHAELLTHVDGRVEVHDLGSTAGTFVNSLPVRNQSIRPGDTIAFGPLAARIVFEEASAVPVPGTDEDRARAESTRAGEERLARLRSDIQEAEARHTELAASNSELARHQIEKAAAVQQLDAAMSAAQQEHSRLRQGCADEENRLGDLRRQLAEVEESCRAAKSLADTHEKQARAAGKKLEQLAHEQQHVEEKLHRIQAEISARENDLVAETRRIEDASARLAGIEVQCQALAMTEGKLAEAREQLAAHDSAMQKAEAAAQERLAILVAREKDLRVELEALGPGVETARDDLAAIEFRLAPLRDWKKAMVGRYARLATLPTGSAEESDVWREIEDAQAALFDLLPAARIETPGLRRGDFSRISRKVGIPMKSDRIRRAGV